MSESQTQKIPDTARAKTDEQMLEWLRLIRSRRVGPLTFVRLVREHGSATAALDALPDIAAASGEREYQPCTMAEAEREYALATAHGARLLCLGNADYPSQLARIDDAPPILWHVGKVDIYQRPAVAIVGARSASSTGRRMARTLAKDLSDAGYVVVSGLARGIDAEAHAASLVGGTIAVQAGGVDHIYPQENTELAQNITDTGSRLSEMPMGMQPISRHFPRRNRIISGLSLAVVVVEGAARSGSIITARDALDQGREVMAVPGSPIDGRSRGCNLLIRDGATLVQSAEDIMEVLGSPTPADVSSTLPPDLTEMDASLPRRLLELLGPTPTPEDELIRLLQCPPRQVVTTLSQLELENRISRELGGVVLA